MKVTEKIANTDKQVLFMCDFSPPRTPDLRFLEPIQFLDMDFVCVGYNPGKSVRLQSSVTASLIRQMTSMDIVFNLVSRDMNKMAIQSQLMGAHALGLENLIVMRGDDFTPTELFRIKPVNDFLPTDLIKATNAMNLGLDYRGMQFRPPTDFCIGAAIDLGKDHETESRLTNLKVKAGAMFFITQPIHSTDIINKFLDCYRNLTGQDLTLPIFIGLQVLEKDSILLGGIPESTRQDLNKGRSGIEIAHHLLCSLVGNGFTNIYLIPPILHNGVRNYGSAQQVVDQFRRESMYHR